MTVPRHRVVEIDEVKSLPSFFKEGGRAQSGLRRDGYLGI
jgi:hypothetical protein